MYRCDVAARRIGRRAVDHHDAERAQREDGGDQRPVDVVVEAAFEHAQSVRRDRLPQVANGSL